MKEISGAIKGVDIPLKLGIWWANLAVFFANKTVIRIRALQCIDYLRFSGSINLRDKIVFTLRFNPDRLDAVHTLRQDSSTGSGGTDGDVQHRMHADSLRQFKGAQGYH